MTLLSYQPEFIGRYKSKSKRQLLRLAGSHLMWLSLKDNAWRQYLLLAEASVMKSRDLFLSVAKEAEDINKVTFLELVALLINPIMALTA